MTGITPNTEAFNSIHMYSFVDYRPHDPNICFEKNSMSGIIFSNPSFSKFAQILKKANRVGEYDNYQLQYTLFLPEDKYIPDELMNTLDAGTARQILNVSTINRPISTKLLKSSPVCKLTTRDPYNRNMVYVTNINDVTELNQCAQVIGNSIVANNGIIHLTNNILLPTDAIFIN